MIRNIATKAFYQRRILPRMCIQALNLNNNLFVNKSLAYFCDKKPVEDEESEQEVQEEKIEMKAMNFKRMRDQLFKSEQSKNLGRYVNKISYSNRMYESSLMKKFRKISNWVYELRPSNREQEQRKEEEYDRKIKRKKTISTLAFWILFSFFAYQAYINLQQKIRNSEYFTYFYHVEDADMSEIKKNKMKSNGKDLQYLLERLAGVRKVTVIEKKKQIDDKKQGKKDINEKFIPIYSAYKIILEHQNGKKETLNPYNGDPNVLLSAMERIQKKKNLPSAIVYYDTEENYTFKQALYGALQFLTPFIGVAITIYIFRKNDPKSLLQNLGMGKSSFKVVKQSEKVQTKFNNVIGMKQAKRQVAQLIDFLTYGEKYRKVGAKIPKGALLTGPPGTGKTMLARACAGEAGVAFFSISGSQFVEVFVGVGAAKVRDIFAQARAEAPSIIFIDEIDAIGKKRQNSRNEEKDSTLNQLLVQMDGFSSNQTVIVLAATNRKQTLDSALTRPGRFDRMVEINLPDVQDRRQIFHEYLVSVKTDPFIGIQTLAQRLAELSPGFSGADIKNLVNQAAIIASRKDGQYIMLKDFEQASERITAGYVKKNLMNKQKRKRVAYHEAGHAVAGWFLKGGDPLLKLTIIPRSKGSLGYAQYVPKNAHILSKQVMIDRIAIMLGGITSQQIFFGQMSSGGSDDLQKVYDLTRRMVAQFGMGKQTYNITLDLQKYVQKESTYLSDLMDKQMFQLLEEGKKRSRNIIEQKRQIIQNLATELLEKQTLNQADILRIMGKRPDFGEAQQNEKQEENEFFKKENVFKPRQSPIY